jgi:hypothetical protein
MENLSNSKFIKNHTAPIQDMAPSPLDQQAIVTVSTDKRVAVCSLRSGLLTLDSTLPVTLWSCAWIEHTTVAVGGDAGRFFIVDGRGQIIVDLSLGVPNPVFAMCRLSDGIVLVSSIVKSRLCDVKARRFIDVDFPGTRVVRGCSDGTFVQITQHGIYTSAEFGHLGRDNSLVIDKRIDIGAYDRLARPAILKIGKEIVTAIPDQERHSFCLRMMSHIEYDMWDEWSSLFLDTDHPSPVVDLALETELDFIVAALSPELLRVYALPIESV